MSDFLKGVNLYLIGMMGAGKTTVGKILAAQLGYRYIDTDDFIEKVAGISIAEIFDRDGEDAFRQLETQVLAELSAYRRCIIATGGGIVTRQMNWSYLHHGIVAWLDVPVNELYRRLQGDTTRPLLQHPDPQAKLQTLLNQRESRYRQADARVVIEPGQTAEQIATRTLDEVKKALKSSPQDGGVDRN